MREVCSNNLWNEIYFVVWWIIFYVVVVAVAVLSDTGFAFREKAIPFDWLLITFRQRVYCVVSDCRMVWLDWA